MIPPEPGFSSSAGAGEIRLMGDSIAFTAS
jgi:hypothetical protein